MQHYAYKFMIFRLGELFCGPGGLAYGATHANIGMMILKLSMRGQTIMIGLPVILIFTTFALMRLTALCLGM